MACAIEPASANREFTRFFKDYVSILSLKSSVLYGKPFGFTEKLSWLYSVKDVRETGGIHKARNSHKHRGEYGSPLQFGPPFVVELGTWLSSWLSSEDSS